MFPQYKNKKESLISTERHICEKCGEKFRNKEAFNNHVREHNKTWK
jgi:hypothetical protein